MSSDRESDSETIVKVSDIACHGLPEIGMPKKPGKFYLQIMVDGQMKQSPVSKSSGNPEWEDSFSFTVIDKGTMSIKVYAKRRLHSDSFVGEPESPVEIVGIVNADRAHSDIILRELFKAKQNGDQGPAQGSIQFRLHYLINVFGMDDGAIERANESVQTIRSPRSLIRTSRGIVFGISKGADIAATVNDLWGSLFQNVTIFIKIVDVLADIHPYAKITWLVLSQPLKMIVNQNKRDQDILALLEKMNDMYRLVLLAKPLEKIKAHRNTVKLMCQQTTECAFFIRDYASRGFTDRMLKSPFNGHSTKVASYLDQFSKLKDDFRIESAVVTEITVFQMATKVDDILLEAKDISAKQAIDVLPYVDRQRVSHGCDEGTRQAILTDIMKWFTQPIDDHAKRLFWLYGVAGCGKSAIAQSVVEQLRAQRRCASFFFDASKQTDRENIYSTISQDLAYMNKGWKASLVKALNGLLKSPKGLTLKMQFETFLLQPSMEMDSIGPILIVIDGLDESGSPDQRSTLLQTLVRLSQLPIQFRFLLTSRPELDIVNAFRNRTWVQSIDLADQFSTNRDIRRFVRNRLLDIPALREGWKDEWIDKITISSGQLFQWAFTACEYIRGDGTVGCNSLERLEELLQSNSYNGLDALYTAILERLCTFQPGDITSRRFQSVMGRALSVREPVSLEVLSSLWSDEEDKNHAKSILSPLGSLLRGVSGQNEPIQPLHASLIDFLTNQERSGRYWINIEHQNEILSRSCLREMQDNLRFNICRLETSYKFNYDISDLHLRVEQSIRPHLSYACCFWVDHLHVIPPTDEWYGPIQVFMQRYLLFWLEALSLLGRVDRALAQLSMLKDWLQSVDNCEELKQLVSDSLRFVEVTAPVLRQSTPHLYLCALSFVPHDSALSKLYLPAFPGSIDVEESDSIRWSSMLLSINTSSQLLSIALSPDGKRIVSGSENKTWSIWDAETGNLLIGPISGRTGKIYSVALSLDGKRVASGSRDATVRIWDAETGEQVTEPLIGHTDGVLSVAFSPDGQHIASGSFDKTIQIWDCKTGANIKTLENGHNKTIRSIAYSSDGKYIASGSDDYKVIIWKWETGDTKILSGHNDIVRSVAFSHDGKQLVSSSGDKTIIIWSTETGKRTLDPLTGHTGPVTCIAFSPDDRCIASGSMDTTVRVWDARTGALVAGPFEGHGNNIFSIVFSSDGKHVISGSADETIKIWDVDAGRGLGNVSDAHDRPVSSVAYSPDGAYFATASWDGTVRLWSATTGKPARELFRDHTDEVYSIAFSPSGEQIISGSRDKSVRIWDVQTGTHAIGYSDAHTDTISCVASSPDGGRVVSGSLDGSVRVWDAETAVLVAGPFVGQVGRVLAVAFSSDGKRVVSSSSDAAVKIWDIESGECVVEPFVGDAGRVSIVAFSPNGTMVVLASKDGSLRVCDVLTGELLMELTNIAAVTSVAMSVDGGLIASGSSDKTVRVWDVKTGESIAEPFVHDDVVEAVALSPNGCYVTSGSSDGRLRVWDVKTGAVISRSYLDSVLSIAFSPDGTRIVIGLANKRVLVLDLDKQAVIVELRGHQNSVHSAIFSADGRRIFSGSADRSLKIWDSQTGNLLAETPTTHSDIVFSVAFSSDGKRVASGSLDKSVRIWDAKTGRLIGRPLLGHTDWVNCVVFSPDSKYIASGSDDETIRIWDTWTGKEVAQPSDDQSFKCLAFSPDNTLLVSGLDNGDIKLWDTKTWNEKATAGLFQGHTRHISSIQFSLDGGRVISSSYDKTIRIWDVKTGSCIAGPFYGHNSDVESVALSPNGAQFVSGSQDNTVKIWNIDFGAMDNSEQETSNTDHTIIPEKPHSYLEHFTDSSKFEDGWMRGPNNELLFWIPPDYRSSIWRPSNIALIGRIVMRLKLDRFTHGTNWVKCFDETQLARTLPDME